MKRVAFIYPGQGSQSVGMGKDFFDNSNIAKEIINNASDRLNIDFQNLLFEKNDKLEQTQYTQPAILLVSHIATKLLLEELDIKPNFVLGHSLGEFSALVSVGAIDYLDAVELVNKRGKFMSEACEGLNASMMAVLGLDDNTIEDIVSKANKQVWAANYNSDGQVVLAGKRDDLEELVPVFKEAGAKRALVLNMSVASHCPMLEPSVEKLAPYLEKFLKDEFLAPVVSNVTAQKYNTKQEAIKLLKEQLVMPVLYKQSIKNFANEVDLFVELGNGKVLQGLNKRGVDTKTISVFDMDSLKKAVEIIKE